MLHLLSLLNNRLSLNGLIGRCSDCLSSYWLCYCLRSFLCSHGSLLRSCNCRLLWLLDWCLSDLRDLLYSCLRLHRCGCNGLMDHLRVNYYCLWDLGLCGGRTWCHGLHLRLSDGSCL